MNTNTEALPQVETSALEAARVAPAATIVPEHFAEHTEAFGHAMMDLMTTPVADVGKPEIFNQRLDEVSHSLDLIYQDANSSMKSLNIAAEEAFRRQYELGLHLMQDLAVVKSPAEAIHLQFNFLAAQAELFMEQSKEMQRQFTSIFFAHKPAARLEGIENRGDK
jgi:hypothetical protein